MSLSIREYTPNDKEWLTDAVRKLHEFVVAIDPIQRLRNMPAYVPHEVEEILTTTQNQQGKIYIAEEEGKQIGCIVGFTTTQSKENLLSVIPTKLGVISDVYVDESFRGKKIGEHLMQTMEKYLKEQGCDTLWITIVAFNTKAHAFYKKNGYTDREIGLMKRI